MFVNAAVPPAPASGYSVIYFDIALPSDNIKAFIDKESYIFPQAPIVKNETLKASIIISLSAL